MSNEHNHEHTSECNHEHEHIHTSECGHQEGNIVEQKSALMHWPIMLLGLIVGLLFIFATFSYQVEENEIAVVKQNGEIVGTESAGLHFKIPIINKIEKFDKRLHCYKGILEETSTKDTQTIVVGIYVVYKVTDFETFINNAGDMSVAEERLSSQMRTAKTGVIGQYKFNQLINPNPKELKIEEIEIEIKKQLNEKLNKNYGITISNVGISNINVPEKISKVIFKRMIAEREFEAQKTISQGESEAAKITQNADKNKSITIANAEAEAKKIMATGDAEAAKSYAVFKEKDKAGLAIYLKKLEAIKKIMDKKTTVIFDTNTAPFDILKTNIKDQQ